MVNIAHEVECSKGLSVGKPMATDGWKSCKHRGRARKPSKCQAGSPWGVQWSKPDCGVCTDEQKLHTEAIRSDEVPHAAEVQNPGKGQYQNSRCSSDRHKDIHLTEGGLGIDLFSMRQEVSRGHSSYWFWADGKIGGLTR